MRQSGEIMNTDIERFGYQWHKYSNLYPYYEEQFLKWIYPLDKDFIKGKKVLDAGCGMGRNSLWCLKYGAKEVTAIDADEKSVAAARRNLESFNNAAIKKENIYDIGYDGYFDFVFSIGVIHHLEFPEKAVASLKKAVRKGGTLLVWLYGYEGNEFSVKLIEFFRRPLCRLPIGLLHYVTFFLSIPFFVGIRLFRPKHPYLRRLSRYNFLHVHSILFDKLLPSVARYYTREDAEKLFQGFDNVSVINKDQYSWTVICTV